MRLPQQGSLLSGSHLLVLLKHSTKNAREQLRIEYFQVLDVALLQLKERLSDSIGLKKYSELKTILLSGKLGVRFGCRLSGASTLNTLQIKISMLRTTQNLDRTKSSVDDYAKLLVTMSPEVRCMFPHIEALVRLLLVNPATSASAECSFSSLCRFETYLRSTIKQSRLNHVTVCHINKSMSDEIEVQELMKQFVMHKDRRISVFRKF